MIKQGLAFTLFLLISIHSWATNNRTLLCTDLANVGVGYDQGTLSTKVWEETQFVLKTNGWRQVIRKDIEYYGEPETKMTCYLELNFEDVVACNSNGFALQINTQDFRYTRSILSPHVLDPNLDRGRIEVSYGRCQPL